MLICNDKIFFLGDNTGDTMINVTGERTSSRCCQLLVTGLRTGVAKFTPVFGSGKNLGGYHGNTGLIK